MAAPRMAPRPMAAPRAVAPRPTVRRPVQRPAIARPTAPRRPVVRSAPTRPNVARPAIRQQQQQRLAKPPRTAPPRVARPAGKPAAPIAAKPAATPAVNAARQAAQQRREQLQQQLRQGNLNRTQRQELRTLNRQERTSKLQERRLQNAEQRLERLQNLQSRGNRMGRAQQRELKRLQAMPQLRERLQARQQSPQLSPGQLGQRRAAGITAQQAQAGRFAAQYRAGALAMQQGNRPGYRDGRRALRLAARAAWQRNAYARYVPWRSAVYWPYAYTDVFYYPFWPAAYEPGYWAYVYDDFFDSVFFPDGAPYVEYAEGPYEGPYHARATTGSAPRRDVPGRVAQEARQVCAAPDKGVTAWPFDRIAAAVKPSAEQKTLLEEMEQAASRAADRLKEACPEDLPMTPAGRLQAMTLRLQATLDAVKLVRPPLEKFYESLSDEQKARFNEIGPEFGRDARKTDQAATQGDCGGEKSGLSSLAIDRIEEVVQPTEAQLSGIDRLSESLGKAVDVLQQACPTTVATTPVGRMETMQQRLEAMIEAANIVRPALDDFYASLSNEQKAKFNRLSRQTAQAN
jgi:hypothetical protein